MSFIFRLCRSFLELNNPFCRQWGKHTNFTNRAFEVVNHLRNSFQAEMVTVAWAKMYECLGAYPLLTKARGPVFTAHLCEAPGAFVCATNHFLRTG